jgi:hypothetical protein
MADRRPQYTDPLTELRSQRPTLLSAITFAEEALTHVVFRASDEPASEMLSSLLQAMFEHLMLASYCDLQARDAGPADTGPLPTAPDTLPPSPDEASQPCGDCNGTGALLDPLGNRTCETCFGAGCI